MTQRRRYQNKHPYFITTKTINNLWMFENEQYATILYNKIICISKYYKANLFSFCIMPDHLHIMIKFAKENDISFYMRDLKSLFVKEIRENLTLKQYFGEKDFMTK